MDINTTADVSLRQVLLQLTSANLQPRLAAELIARTMEGLVQIESMQTAQAAAQPQSAPAPAISGASIDIVA